MCVVAHPPFEAAVAACGCSFVAVRGEAAATPARSSAASSSPTLPPSSHPAPSPAVAPPSLLCEQLDAYACAMLRDPQPHVVCFNWFGSAAGDLASRLSIPAVGLWPGAPMSPTAEFACPLLPTRTHPPHHAPSRPHSHAAGWAAVISSLDGVRRPSVEAWAARARHAPSAQQRHTPQQPPARHPILHLVSPSFLPAGRSPHDWPRRVAAVGFCAREAAASPPPSPRVAAFLAAAAAARAPVVYAGTGSVALSPAAGARFCACVSAGARAAGCRLLLVAPPLAQPPDTTRPTSAPLDDAAHGAGGACGGGEACGGCLDCPHVCLLPHDGSIAHAWLFPQLAAVIHHGGAGTTACAATAGVPQVLVPCLFDQHWWAAQCARLGVSPLPLRLAVDAHGGEALCAESVARALRFALGAGAREAAAELARALRAEPPGEEVAAGVVVAVARGAA